MRGAGTAGRTSDVLRCQTAPPRRQARKPTLSHGWLSLSVVRGRHGALPEHRAGPPEQLLEHAAEGQDLLIPAREQRECVLVPDEVTGVHRGGDRRIGVAVAV